MKFLRALGATLVAWGPPGAFLIALLDGAGVPLPDAMDVVLVAMAAHDVRTAWISAGLALIGTIAGSLFLFYIARKGGEAFLDRKTQSGTGKKMREWFQRYGGITVFIPALIPMLPLPLKVPILCAGALGMSVRSFVLIMLAARIPRYAALVYFGSQLGAQPLEYMKGHALYLLAIAAALFLVLFLLVRLKDRARAAANPA